MRKSVNSMLAILVTCSPNLVASDGVGPAPIVRKSEQVVLKNVELSSEGTLAGQLLNKSGQAIPGVVFTVEQTESAREVSSGADGKFVIDKLRPGQCVFRVDDEVFACRVWKRGAAPPNSLQTFALVSSKDVVRGQIGIPLPLPPLPGFPASGSLMGLGGGGLMGVTILAVGGGAIAISASNDSSPNASL